MRSRQRCFIFRNIHFNHQKEGRLTTLSNLAAAVGLAGMGAALWQAVKPVPNKSVLADAGSLFLLQCGNNTS